MSRVALATVFLHGLSLAAVLGVGVALYQLNQKVDSIQGGPEVAMGAGVGRDLVPPGDVGQGETPNAPGAADPFLEVTRRLAKLEEQIKQVASIVGKIAVSAAPQGYPLTDEGWDKPQESFAELRARGDLGARFQAEAATSPWGRSAAAAIDQAYSTASTESPFFAEHGGNVSTDCRESVCSVSWSPPVGEASQLSEGERVDLLERAKWELLSLAGAAEESGQVRFFTNPASDPPTIELMIDHSPGGDVNIPDKVGTYLGIGR
jgi:hypothetical protein